MTDAMGKLANAVADKPSTTQPEGKPAEEKPEEFVEENNKMTEDEIDSAVEDKTMSTQQAEDLKKEYGYAKKEDKEHVEKIQESVKGKSNKGDLNAALHNVRGEKTNLQNQLFYGQNKVKDAQKALKDLEDELKDETFTVEIKSKFDKLSKVLNGAEQELHLSKDKMHRLQIDEIAMDDENYPAHAEVWKLAKERMQMNPTESEEAEKSGNLALTAYTIGMRHPKAQDAVAKFKAKARLSDKIAKNLEALKKRRKSPGTPSGPGAGRKVTQTPRLKELKEKLKKKTTEEDLHEAIGIVYGKKP